MCSFIAQILRESITSLCKKKFDIEICDVASSKELLN